jgi:hypothetical protein
MDMLIDLLPKLPNLKAICYECEGVSDEQEILLVLAKLKQLVMRHSSNPQLVATLTPTLSHRAREEKLL